VGFKKAVLIFAAEVRQDLFSRGLSERFAELLRGPSVNSDITSIADIHLFTTAKSAAEQGFFDHQQSGASFGERLTNAVRELVQLGYTEIVVVGSDCPELQSGDIATAFQKLDSHRLVIGPDHRGGCYLIALHAEDSAKLSDVRWQVNTDCAELQLIFGSARTFLLRVKHDIDSIADIRLLATRNSKWGLRAKTLLLQGQTKEILPADATDLPLQLAIDAQRPRWQLPPPPIFSSFM